MESSTKMSSDALDVLQQTLNEVIVQMSRVIKESTKDARAKPTHVGNSGSTRLQSSVFNFNCALDDVETEIVRAKSVLLRDLTQLRAKRMPPPAPTPEPQPVAPPAPMSIEDDGPLASDAVSTSAPAAAAPPPFSTSAPPVKNESKPVAPVPDMGFDLTVSPEIKPAASPAMSHAKAKQVKSSPKPTPAQAAAMAGRPASVPPKKSPRAVAQPQPPRTATSTPHQPTPATAPPAAAPPAPTMAEPLSLPPSAAPAPATTTPAPVQPPASASQPEMAFTNMTFSNAPPANESSQDTAQAQTQAPPPQQQPVFDSNMIDLTQFDAPGDLSGNLLNMASFDTGADSGLIDLTGGKSGSGQTSNNNNPGNGPGNNNNDSNDNADAEIENLLNSAGPNSVEKMEMDYELGGISLDNNSFDEMFFDNASGGDEDFGPDTYYGI